MNDVHLENHVLIHEVCESLLVCNNASYLCSCKEYIFRLLLCKEVLYSIYTPASFAKSSLLYLQEIGTLKANREHISRRADLDSFLFFFINEGSGELFYEGEHYSLKKGDCVFISCMNSYSHTTSPDLWNISWIHFNGPEMLKIYDKYRQRGGGPIFHPDENVKQSDRENNKEFGAERKNKKCRQENNVGNIYADAEENDVSETGLKKNKENMVCNL